MNASNMPIDQSYEPVVRTRRCVLLFFLRGSFYTLDGSL